MISMGCTVDLKKLWALVKRPWGLAIGVVCQFGFMPLIAFTLAISFKLKSPQAIAVLIMGCCPGGVISNIMSYWVDGDMDLSISMTVFSTILATGFLPLNLFIYSPAFIQANGSSTNIFSANNCSSSFHFQELYKNIGITLTTLILPIVFGIFIAWKWPKKSRILLKCGSVAGAVIFFITAVATTLLYKGAWKADLSLLIIGAINPLMSYTAGFLVALILQQSWKRCRTIGFETGAQSGQLCTAILMVSFSAGDLKLMLAYPAFYIFFQLVSGFILVSAYQLYKRFRTSTEA
ncbi:sodium-dependent organic anion transporter-like [Hypanus sabinus]|uniref:sodium-dependent organic anion transporter-like n=1 Tax=Hypanus sabinus TaxID=79690 RepID=UPI0028C4517A|nr:sodium-dependent organic anion transporter-like [Hypanus sabinus]